MKAQEYRQGEVTAFLALIFILLVSFTGSMMESASLQSAKSYRRADVNRAMESVFAEYQRELLEEFDIFALDGSYESRDYDEQRVLDRMSYYGASGIEQKVSRIQLLTDRNGQAFLEQVAYYIESKYGLSSLNGLLDGMGEWDGQEERVDDLQQTESETQGMLTGILEENQLELPAEDNPLPNIQSLASAPLVELAMPQDQTVSEKSVEAGRVVSGRRLREGYGEFPELEGDEQLSSIAFGEYVLTHFSSAVQRDETIRGGALDYELEYILADKYSDRENLETVLKKLLLIRIVPNYAYLRGSVTKRAEAQALAISLCAVMAFPAAAEALAQVLLFAWAFGESIVDLRSLLNGNRVPAAKTDESWQLPLAGLMTLGTADDHGEGRDDVGGLRYEDYLRILLFLHSRQDMPLRTLDMIELCLQQEEGLSWFRADNCISRIETENKVSLRRGITYQFRTCYGYR